MSDKILIVDDEVEIADLIEVYLKNENFTVLKFYLHCAKRFGQSILIRSLC